MLLWILLVLFGLSCLLLIAQGVTKRTGLLGYPFLAGCGMLGFMLPQAIGIVRHGSMAPEAGVMKALAMCILCNLAVHFGWKHRVKCTRSGPSEHVNPIPWYGLGLAFLAVGVFGWWKLTSLTGGVAEFYSIEGSYALEWRGLPVAYAFFADYLLVGFVIVGLVGLRVRSWHRVLPAAVPLVIQLAAIVFLGRRSQLVALGLATLCVLYFGKRFFPPKFAVRIAVPLVMAAMFLAPQYRTHSQLGADHSEILEIDPGTELGDVLGGVRGEFWSMAHLFEICESQGLYQYGLGFYNRFVSQFVPKLLVGERTKELLFLDLPSAQHVANQFNWRIPIGMVPGGPFSVYEQFWYFGCVVFYLLSAILKKLWVRALFERSVLIQVSYVVLLTPSVAALTNSIGALYAPVFKVILPVYLISKLMLPSRGKLRSSRPHARPRTVCPTEAEIRELAVKLNS